MNLVIHLNLWSNSVESTVFYDNYNWILLQEMRQVWVEYVQWVTIVPQAPPRPSPVELEPSAMWPDCPLVTNAQQATTASWEQTTTRPRPVTQGTTVQRAPPQPLSTPVQQAPSTIWQWPPLCLTACPAQGENIVPHLDLVHPLENAVQVHIYEIKLFLFK